tara:strand:+ start:137 stop:457 length:321 start_codon:yes stop_codon:yes gene_type:complete
METITGDCPLGAKCEEVKTVNEKQVLVRCPWYTKVAGTNVNTGKESEDWGCSIAWLPALLINGSNESRKSTIAIESFRNETVRDAEKTRQVLAMPFNERTKLINDT